MKKTRPVNLDLFSFRFPLVALTSIAHRIAGIVLFAAIPLLLCWLACSLKSEADFAATKAWLDTWLGKGLAFLISAALIYHLIAGIRHLIMDFGIGETLSGGQKGSQLIIALSSILILLWGVWLW